MSWPDGLLERGEHVTGRWISRGIAFAFELVGLYGLIAIVVFLAGEVWLDGDGAESGFWLYVALLAPLPIIVGIIAVVDAGGRPPIAVLTERRLLWRVGIFRPGIHKLAITAIAEVTAYEAGGGVCLKTRDGKTVRITGLGDASGLAEALGVPGRIWRSSQHTHSDRQHHRFVAVTSGVANGVSSIGMLTLLLFVFHPEWGIWPLPLWLALPSVLLLGTMVAAALSLVVSGILPHLLAQRQLQGEALHDFACRQLCRLCQGREPYPATGGTLWDRIERPLDRWIIRWFYGGHLDCTCEPEIVEPGAWAGHVAV